MDKIVQFFDSVGMDFSSSATAMLLLFAGIPLLFLLTKWIFGKESIVGHSVASVIAVLFLYALAVMLQCWNIGPEQLVTPLPLIEIENNSITLLSLQSADYNTVCSQCLSLIILVFLVNTVEHLLSRGERFFVWILFRILIVVAAFILHGITVTLLPSLLPESFMTYTPTVLLNVLLVMLAAGALKLMTGALLANPLIGGLFTFFFVNIVGKRLTTAVLTAALLIGLLSALSALGITTIVLSVSALAIYIPFFIVLLALWYLVNRIF